jgi:DNA-directed RNA polymerase subunit N (RpoN/RPB10)
MKAQGLLAPLGTLRILAIERDDVGWIVSATCPGCGPCPACGTPSSARHSTYRRRLQDLPVQGSRVVIELSVARLRCRNQACSRKVFAERLPGVAGPLLRRTDRVLELLRLLGHSSGGRPAERILARLGLVVSDDTVIRHVKRHARERPETGPLRVLGIDDWSWRSGQTYGTIMVDLERHTVVDVLSDRSAVSVAAWLGWHPEVEVISRDRHGLYAEGAQAGAPQACQIADRFHLLQNLRERIEQQMGRLGRPVRLGVSAATEAEGNRTGLHNVREALFSQVRTLYKAGKRAADIVRELGLSRKRVDRWIKLEALPPRNAITSSSASPSHFVNFLTRRWGEGCTRATQLLVELKDLGYTGSYSHLARFIASWRRKIEIGETAQPQPPPKQLPRDPTTGRPLSPLTAGALCIKPRTQLTERQAAIVDTLKALILPLKCPRFEVRVRHQCRSGAPRRMTPTLAG